MTDADTVAVPAGTPRTRVAINRIAALPRTGRQLLKWYSHLNVWHRLILGALLGALGGSTFIGFLNTYAVYRYAFRYDARIPVEGVPYLGLAASILSFAFLFVALSCATLIYALLRATTAATRTLFGLAASFISRVLRPSLKGDIQHVATWLTILSSALSGFITAGVSELVTRPFRPEPEFGLMVAVLVAGVCLTILSINPDWVRWVALYLALGLVFLTSAALFDPEFYAARLRQIGYGGGMPITLICDDEKPCVSNRSLRLFLITSDTYVTHDSANREYVEVPKREVKRVQYDPDKRHALPQNRR